MEALRTPPSEERFRRHIAGAAYRQQDVVPGGGGQFIGEGLVEQDTGEAGRAARGDEISQGRDRGGFCLQRLRVAGSEEIGETHIDSDDLDLAGASTAIGIYRGTGQQQRRRTRLVGEQLGSQLLPEVARGQHHVLDITETLESQCPQAATHGVADDESARESGCCHRSSQGHRHVHPPVVE